MITARVVELCVAHTEEIADESACSKATLVYSTASIDLTTTVFEEILYCTSHILDLRGDPIRPLPPPPFLMKYGRFVAIKQAFFSFVRTVVLFALPLDLVVVMVVEFRVNSHSECVRAMVVSV